MSLSSTKKAEIDVLAALSNDQEAVGTVTSIRTVRTLD
jgi:hypothetical protein